MAGDFEKKLLARVKSAADNIDKTIDAINVCDECGEPAVKRQRDASNVMHRFCEPCWVRHVQFTGNAGEPYGW